MTPKKIGKLAAYAGAGIFGLFAVTGAFSYNDAGYCQHIRTAFGTESSQCTTGWFFKGWGWSTAWPHEITIGNGVATSQTGSDVAPAYSVRLSDNWRADITQMTRFQIPQDTEQFLSMARDFRTPERLISATLRPAVDASLDSVANLFTMEDYYSGGKRDEFKNEFSDAINKGRARVIRQEMTHESRDQIRASANDMDSTQDTSDVGETETRSYRMEKLTDASGNVLRSTHDFTKYGVTVSSAVLSNLDPDDAFEEQQNSRKQAVSRRIIAREQRLEQEEQRLLAIQTGETDIAKRQAEAKVEQIQKTTEAETQKKLTLIAAQRVKEEAAIIRDTAAIGLETARVNAQSKEVSANAAAYEKRVILEADGALQQKLEAWVDVQKVWAGAASKINVPSTVIGGGANSGSALNTVDNFMNLMTMKTAQDLSLDTKMPTVAKPAN